MLVNFIVNMRMTRAKGMEFANSKPHSLEQKMCEGAVTIDSPVQFLTWGNN